jgi:hypothetical protein
LVGASPCATLTADRWTDITPVLAGGSWVATFASTGSIGIEMVAPGMADVRVRSTVLMGAGTIQSLVAATPEGDLVTTTLTRAGESRPVFRLALDRRPSGARARLRAGGARPTLDVCALTPVHPLFEPGRPGGVLRADFESEVYFGAGWTDAQRTATGPVRRGEEDATLFLPLERGVAYRLLLDLAADQPFNVDVTLNDVPVGTCRPHAVGACNLLLPPSGVVAGTNTVRLSPPRGSPARLTFREARLQIVQ